MVIKIFKYINGQNYHTDQNFIQEYIWPIASQSNMTHDDFFENKKFPKERCGLEYVGEPFDADDKPCDCSHREALRISLKK